MTCASDSPRRRPKAPPNSRSSSGARPTRPQGAACREDLFGEEIYFENTALLHDLALARLKADAATHSAAGWKWVETAIERPSYDDTAEMARTLSPATEIERRRQRTL